MTTFREGDLVNITIENVPVTQLHPGTDEDMPEMTVYLECDIGGQPIRIPHHWPMVTVERTDPHWWPPRPGDLLVTPTGLRLFAMARGSNVTLVSPYGEEVGPQESWEQRHDLTLVHRKGQS